MNIKRKKEKEMERILPSYSPPPNLNDPYEKLWVHILRKIDPCQMWLNLSFAKRQPMKAIPFGLKKTKKLDGYSTTRGRNICLRGVHDLGHPDRPRGR